VFIAVETIGRFGVIVGRHHSLEGLVVVGILECGNDGLGGEVLPFSGGLAILVI
jgi:hypothetical protein